jgi:hypothetical protein
MEPHFLNLRGARLVKTPYWLLGRQAMQETVEARAIASITGPPGTGKSFLLCSVAPDLKLPFVRVEFDHRPTMLSITSYLLFKLTGERPRGSKHDLIEPLVTELGRFPRVLLVDEAQRLNRECLDHLRMLHDHIDTDFALILAGGQGCWEVLGKDPQLRRRIYRPVFFRPLTPDEVLALIPELHPIWRRVSDSYITLIDVEFAGGLLGNWAAITHTLQALVNTADGPIGEPTIKTALFKHGIIDDEAAA